MNRHAKNPILTRIDIPDIYPNMIDATSVFNPGAIKFNDKYILILRVQNRGRETFLMKAVSHNGIDFLADNKLIEFKGIEKVKEKIYHCYDARVTFLEGRYYLMFAMDMETKCGLGLAVTDDFENYEFLGLTSNEDTRNGVLFPEKINGKYLRLERPNKVQLSGGPTSGNTIVVSESDDLLNWNMVEPLMSGRFHYWDELIGSGPTPVKTREGWLHVYHGVATHFGSANIYQGGVSLLDLNNPAKLLARGRYNILEPRELYELTGQVPNVCFPSGMIVEEFDKEGYAKPESKVLIYYGAADTSVGLLETTVQELINEAKAV
jgi:beta-1,4-mannooligosaccharide/beta-1,4-mannosyl-N-acetylglucosamine phosphorylase